MSTHKIRSNRSLFFRGKGEKVRFRAGGLGKAALRVRGGEAVSMIACGLCLATTRRIAFLQH